MMNKITFDKNGFSEQSGFVSAHCVETEGFAYIGPRDVYVSAGTGLPSNAYLDGPGEIPDGFWPIREAGGAWEMAENHLGKTAYCKETRIPHEVINLGPIPDTHTLIPPSSPFDKWSEQGVTWVFDENEAEQATLKKSQAEHSARLVTANEQIATLKPAVDGGYAKPSHTQLLADWQRHCYELTLVPEQPGWPENPQWPTEPERII